MCQGLEGKPLLLDKMQPQTFPLEIIATSPNLERLDCLTILSSFCPRAFKKELTVMVM